MNYGKHCAVTLAAAAFLAAGAVTTSSATATPAAGQRGALASFEHRQIDLSRGWGEARACGVWRTRDGVACFRTVAELDRHAALVERGADRADPRARCASPLQLGQDENMKGRVLRFYDRGSWQNLGAYGFNDETSAYRTGACTAHLARDANGGGNWYPGYTGPNHTEIRLLSGWNDEITSLKID
ncbi:hypothetical protein [Streptomyces sp. NPDC057702]|uniref:hypothetical protein n=1 Tax=unclassified Streptomyces TaxID=2593676 RepID=UPI0036CCB68B